MATQDDRRTNDPIALMQGTLELLILHALILGKQHGQGIARDIERSSGGVLLVDHGSLYPALQRLEAKRWIAAEWGTSDNNRRARFYALTRTGKAELRREAGQWQRLVAAMSRVMKPAESGN
jgi:transcriptional regulator